MRHPRHSRPGRRGVSLLEVVLAATLFTGIGYVLSLSMRASDQSYGTVASSVEANAEIRAFTVLFTDELKGARQASIAAADNGGFSTIEFQTAIESAGGGPTWGAFERGLDVDEANCSQAGWSVRYGVEQAQDGTNELVRSIVDDVGAVQHTRTLAAEVTEFSVNEVGDVWVVGLTTQGNEGTRHEEFDVRTRDR